MILRIPPSRVPAWRLLFALCAFFLLVAEASHVDSSLLQQHAGTPLRAPGDFQPDTQNPFNPTTPQSGEQPHPFDPPLNSLEELHHALETMQSDYFEIWLGKWPAAIDWTAAVMSTHVSAALYTLTRSLSYIMPGTLAKDTPDMQKKSSELELEGQRIENEINKYFSQIITYFFGEDHFAIRTQAYDDMLWVVLGWLESIRFIQEHDGLHYPPTSHSTGGSQWYGKQFESAFAHRARVFYDLAQKGWDWKLCGGGMTWSPHTQPYKNAVTNELFIAASAGMYLYFPGDSNCSPYLTNSPTSADCTRDSATTEGRGCCTPPYGPTVPHDPVYLAAAVNGYAWLKQSNMTNAQGLYVDGYHIRDWGKNGSIGTGKCDERNEMVYTYNQGVLLSGLRGLWEGTGDVAYLEDGHALIRSVIRATGWRAGWAMRVVTFAGSSPSQQAQAQARPESEPEVVEANAWAGLGVKGILTELCDPAATCSQDSQTFKGIFFHHLTLFCASLPLEPRVPGKTHAATPAHAMLHAQSCREYAPWVVRNARAALGTRDR
ncbi:glycoside hydrolase family 76 protein, partial [Glonium stellatum]